MKINERGSRFVEYLILKMIHYFVLNVINRSICKMEMKNSYYWFNDDKEKMRQ